MPCGPLWFSPVVLLACHLHLLINPGPLSGVSELGPRQLSCVLRQDWARDSRREKRLRQTSSWFGSSPFLLLEALALSGEGRFPVLQGRGLQGSRDYEFVHDQGMHIA